jgi:hypothetical protein
MTLLIPTLGVTTTGASAHAATVKAVSAHAATATSAGHAATHRPARPEISAGSNGQQVYIANGASTEVEICGTNQNNKGVCGYWYTTPNAYNYFSGWWWKYTITIYGNDGWALRCSVPVSQSGNWTYCGYLP